MTVFNKAWIFLKDEEELLNIPGQAGQGAPSPTGEFGPPEGMPVEEGNSMEDAANHFNSFEYGHEQLDEMLRWVSSEASNGLEAMWGTYKEGHPDWPEKDNEMDNTHPNQGGPPGADHLSKLIEEAAERFGAQLPWDIGPWE